MVTLLFYIIVGSVFVFLHGSTGIQVLWTTVVLIDVVIGIVKVANHLKEHKRLRELESKVVKTSDISGGFM